MGRPIKPAKMDDLETEFIRQKVDEIGMGTPNYGEPLSAKYRAQKKRRAAKGKKS